MAGKISAEWMCRVTDELERLQIVAGRRVIKWTAFVDDVEGVKSPYFDPVVLRDGAEFGTEPPETLSREDQNKLYQELLRMDADGGVLVWTRLPGTGSPTSGSRAFKDFID